MKELLLFQIQNKIYELVGFYSKSTFVGLFNAKVSLFCEQLYSFNKLFLSNNNLFFEHIWIIFINCLFSSNSYIFDVDNHLFVHKNIWKDI